MQARLFLSMVLTAISVGLAAHPAQAQVFQSEAIYASPLTQSPSNIYQYPSSTPNQPHSNIYQYPSSTPNQLNSNIYRPPTGYQQPGYQQPDYQQPGYQQPSVIYQQPNVIYRRTEIVSPDGNRRVILEDPQYIIPNDRVIINPDRRYHHRRTNTNRRPNISIYYRF
jgi:hypothetical protein